jgi:hypothetical protein
MSFRVDKPHPYTVGDVVRVQTITNIAESTNPTGPDWCVDNTHWLDGEPHCALRMVGQSGGITRRVPARRCRLVSAVDRLGDVTRAD